MSRSKAGGPSRGGVGGGGGAFGGGGGFGSRAGGPSGTGSSYNFADGRVEDDRINADELRGQQHQDDEEKYTPTGAKITTTKKKRPILPVGIKREEIREGGVELTTAEDIAAGEQAAKQDVDASDDESMWVGDSHKIEAGMKKDDEVWDHVAPRDQKVLIKNEHGDMVEATAIDEILALKEEKKKPIADIKKARRDAEEEQIADDMERLIHLLTIGDSQDQTPDENGNIPPNPLEGHLFLFQLPPVLPPLKITRQPQPKGPGDEPSDSVKDEPSDDIVMFDQPAANIDLTSASATPDPRGVKPEDGIDVDDDDLPQENEQVQYYPPEGGYVGKLVVRRSGKVELDWGGQTLEMVPGIETNFLTTAVLVEEKNPLARAGEAAGTAYGMGKIEGKFVLAPRWHDEEEWVVDPSELEVDESIL